MAQPKFVPQAPTADKYYVSPPRREGSWTPTRPGEVVRHGQPIADGMGSQGPDQGYAIKLAKHLESEVQLQDGEHFADVMSGCVAVALKRASQFMRGPSIHDMRAAFGLFGFFEDKLPADQVAVRKYLFSEVAHPHHYAERRFIADIVDPEFLKSTPDEIIAASGSFLSQLVAAQ